METALEYKARYDLLYQEWCRARQLERTCPPLSQSAISASVDRLGAELAKMRKVV